MQTAYERSVLADVVADTLPLGYQFDPVVSTGGNCFATVLTAPDGRTLYLTDGDAALPFDGLDDEQSTGIVVAGYYDSDDEFDGSCTIDADEKFDANLAITIRAWVDGDPYRDVDADALEARGIDATLRTPVEFVDRVGR